MGDNNINQWNSDDDEPEQKVATMFEQIALSVTEEFKEEQIKIDQPFQPQTETELKEKELKPNSIEMERGYDREERKEDINEIKVEEIRDTKKIKKKKDKKEETKESFEDTKNANFVYN